MPELKRGAPPGGGGPGINVAKLDRALASEAYDPQKPDRVFCKVLGGKRVKGGLDLSYDWQRSATPLPDDVERGTVTLQVAVDLSVLDELGLAPEEGPERQRLRDHVVAQVFGGFLSSEAPTVSPTTDEDLKAPKGSERNPIITSAGPAGGL